MEWGTTSQSGPEEKARACFESMHVLGTCDRGLHDNRPQPLPAEAVEMQLAISGHQSQQVHGGAPGGETSLCTNPSVQQLRERVHGCEDSEKLESVIRSRCWVDLSLEQYPYLPCYRPSVNARRMILLKVVCITVGQEFLSEL